MQVFKFGGASVADAMGVKNVLRILKENNYTPKVVVISAMGKTTNALERVVHSYFDEPELLMKSIDFVNNFHLAICSELFKKEHPVFKKMTRFFNDLKAFLELNRSTNYDYVYDQVVPFGELLSTTIVSNYLVEEGMQNMWLDARTLIKTNATYRDAKVDWQETEKQIKAAVEGQDLVITQGFIGADENNWTTTLGREGSDYTAGIFAYCLDAENVSIWKNVDGVLNADPREFSETTLLEQISYQETIELAFYGASVIHPKTIQPLQRKGIKLFVKSFINSNEEGTTVGNGAEILPEIPCYIVKKELILLSLSTQDFSFFVEENISEVFALFHKYQTKVHLIQNSAISFSVCIDNKFKKAGKLVEQLRHKFKVSYNRDVSLYTIRHFNQAAIERINADKTVLLEQRTRGTIQFVTKN